MKPETRLFVMGYDGKPCGPFRWTLVREWLALGYFALNDEVRPADGVNWRPMSTLPQLLAIPPGDAINDAVAQVREHARDKIPVGPRAAAYLKRLGCPVHPDRLNPHTAFHWVRILEELNPSLVDRLSHWAAEEEANGRTPTESPEHATGSQLETLRSLGRNVPANLTWIEAQRLISGPPTASQLRRLKFYGIPLPEGAGKDEAADLIDRHMHGNWAAEEAFQAAERGAGTGSETGDKPSVRWKLRDNGGVADAEPALPPHSSVPRSSTATPASPADSLPAANRPRRNTLLVAGLSALGIAAAVVAWGPMTRWTTGGRPEPARESTVPDAPRLDLVTVLQATDAAAGDQLRTFAASLKFTGVMAAAEPSAIVDGVAYRVGDVIDSARRVAVVDIDVANNALVVSDASGGIVKRRLR